MLLLPEEGKKKQKGVMREVDLLTAQVCNENSVSEKSNRIQEFGGSGKKLVVYCGFRI